MMICRPFTDVTMPFTLEVTSWPLSRATPLFDARSHCGRLRTEQRHGLALHIGTHQRAVGVVVFQERYEGRGHAHDLHGRNVHKVRLAGRPLGILVAHPDLDPVLDKLVEVIQLCISLGDPEFSSLSAESQTMDSSRLVLVASITKGRTLIIVPSGSRRIAAMRLAPMDTLSFTIT